MLFCTSSTGKLVVYDMITYKEVAANTEFYENCRKMVLD
jgi:hypothetical protein